MEVYEPFNNAEDVWFWFCRSLLARGDGLRSRSDYPGKKRGCEIGDISRILKTMRQKRLVTNRHLRVMAKWGKLARPPHYESRASCRDVRLWDYGMYVFDYFLRLKGIL